jgi:saccharopine dehydrogenase-like NADP-dependent oxidoreductase
VKHILIIGAGKSATYLIEYLLNQGLEHNWQITLADANLAQAAQRVQSAKNGKAIQFDVNDITALQVLVQNHDIVVSMLPANMHGEVAKACVAHGKHMVTASYVSETMKALHEEAKLKGLVLMNECGLDPGIDHASAMKIMDEIKVKGGTITAFKSYCGGLVSPESNTNPWGYKFSWNPRNVVLAGQNTAIYLDNGAIKHIPENRIFTQTETISIKDLGQFDGYANRDSLSYKDVYGLENIKTLIRGTLRQAGYCKAWNALVKLGLTDDSFIIKKANQFTYTTLALSFLGATEPSNLKSAWQELLGNDWDNDVESKLTFLGFFSDEAIVLEKGTPAQLLQNLLERKWQLMPDDKDMIVMQHIVDYTIDNKPYRLFSSLVELGENQTYTAMAKTVGLPAAIITKQILLGQLNTFGVVIPTIKDIYLPLLKELEAHDIVFNEEIIDL